MGLAVGREAGLETRAEADLEEVRADLEADWVAGAETAGAVGMEAAGWEAVAQGLGEEAAKAAEAASTSGKKGKNSFHGAHT